MTKGRYLFIVIIILLSTAVSGQWVEDRNPFPKEESEFSLVYLQRSKTFDYKYDESGNFVCDFTVHEIVKVYNDDALAAFNRVYIPISDMIELIDLRSRAISSEGEIVSLDKNNIHEVKDEEEDSGYRIFAVEGAEVGGEIEYLYTKRISGRTFVNEVYQFDSPVKVYQLTVVVPENLEFEFYPVNGQVEVTVEKTEEVNRYQATIRDIPALVPETFSGGDANKGRIDFRLSYNSVAGDKRLNTFSSAGKRIYDNLVSLEKEEIKLVENYLKEKLVKSGDKWDQFRKLEHEIKQAFYTEDTAPDDLGFLFENSFGSKRALTKLFVRIIRELEINYEVVLTSKRFEMKLIPNFDHWNYLTNYMIYFPETGQFMAPHDERFRIGSIPADYTATSGLFIKPEIITDFEYPVSRIDYIHEESYQENMNNLDIKVKLSEDLTMASLDVKRTYIGNEANFYKYALLWMDEDRKEEMLNDLVKYLAVDADIDEIKVEEANNDADNWNEPFVVFSKFSSENYLEVAGNTILFKLGDLIGAQSELYQEEERIFEIENFNNRGYIRTIELKIPDGYEIENADDIIIDQKVFNGEKPIFVFDSSYSLDNNILRVEIIEFYDQIYYPKEDFEEFRKVINAAADWNKVTLVIKEL
ncbi:MAG: DUF3857 domain-containing protein [Cyclobacteriaceae bacterium]